MKKMFLLACTLCLSVCAMAQTAFYVYKTDGSRVKYAIADVDSISFTAPKTGDTESGHEWVDLGLPSGLKWATCNVGANSPEEYGDYFAWGETETKTDYSWDTYKWGTATYNAEYDYWVLETLTKYNTSSTYGTVDNKTTLDPEDDAVAVNWGGKWRMPTDDEWTELRNECTWTWVEGYNGTDKNGYEVKSNANGNSIFLPAAGCRIDDGLNYAGSYGYYWSSSLDTGRPFDAWYVYFYSGGVGRDYGRRCYGISVRPVCKK